MSLAHARLPDGSPLELPPGPPYPAAELVDVAGAAFSMPPGDPRLQGIHEGGPAPTPPLDNLVGMVEAWQEDGEWLDFLEPDAPNHDDLLLERGLYLHHWGALLPEPPARVLDLGGGVGRFATWLLDRGYEVELVDPDLRSLWRALRHVAGRPGRVDLHWSTGERLPDVEPVDAVLATEVLCYTEDPARVLANLRHILRPGGALFCSVEARWGWAAAPDVAPGTLPALLGDGVVHVPGDRWVRTFDEAAFRELLAGWTIERMVPTHYVMSGPFEQAWSERSLDSLLEVEARFRAREEVRHMHRAWLAVARRP